MKLSLFGQKLKNKSGITILMDDLGSAMASGQMNMLGGGNPAHIPEVQKIFRDRMHSLLDEEGAFETMIGNYDGSAGNAEFIEALAILMKKEFGWQVGPENIALTNGSQNAFFCIFNLLAGQMPDGSKRKVLFPLAPEYIGYNDAGLCPDLFIAQRPEIELLDHHQFKYHVDFKNLKITEEIGAICVSRPTNPTGNVISDDELLHLDALARENNIPLIIDNAYGTPFPNIIFSEAKPLWNENTIICMSLSKFGLPNLRTGIVIAPKETIQLISEFNGIMALAPGGVGAKLALELVKSGEIINISKQTIQPFYQAKANKALEWLNEELGTTIPWRVHKPEGALFLWLWFKDLPIPAQELYERLKTRNTLVVPGHYFFPGMDEDNWQHKHECIRMTYAMNEEVVHAGIKIIGDEIKEIYASAQ